MIHVHDEIPARQRRDAGERDAFPEFSGAPATTVPAEDLMIVQEKNLCFGKNEAFVESAHLDNDPAGLLLQKLGQTIGLSLVVATDRDLEALLQSLGNVLPKPLQIALVLRLSVRSETDQGISYRRERRGRRELQRRRLRLRPLSIAFLNLNLNLTFSAV